jgi:hypothetical protein
MNAVVSERTSKRREKNFYISTLAPVNHRGEVQFQGWDAVLTVVLFVEIVGVMRLLFAN